MKRLIELSIQKSIMGDCIICCEKYNKSNRKEVKCLQCDETCCRVCNQTYLLSRDIIDCMFCNKPQTFEHIKKSHYNTFINSTGSWKGKGYREHQEEVYFKNELSMFPQTLFEIERERKITQLYENLREKSIENKEIINELKNLRKTKKELCKCNNSFNNCICIPPNELNELIKNEDELYVKTLLIKNEINKIWKKINYINSTLFEGFKQKTEVFQKCMSVDCDCYLDSEWYCTKCCKTTCKHCREIKEKNHKCDKELVKTIKFVESTSKPCPKCNERIHRIHGCDQMYCPLCKVIFSYSTGELQIGGIIHQPDAVKELRKTGKLHRDVRDIPCGGVNNIFLSTDEIKYPYLKHKVFSKIIYALLRWCVEYEDIQLRGFGELQNINNINRIYREEFLKGNISKDKFKSKIYNKYKSYEKDSEDQKLIAGFYICLSDMLRSFEDMKENTNIYNQINEIFQLIQNYNIEFSNISKIYKNINYNTHTFGFVTRKINEINCYRFGKINEILYGRFRSVDLEVQKFK